VARRRRRRPSMLDWASYGTQRTSLDSVCSARVGHDASLFHASLHSSALPGRCLQRGRDGPLARRELVTKIDASTNNPEGNRVSGRSPDRRQTRRCVGPGHWPASTMFHILLTTLVREKIPHLLRFLSIMRSVACTVKAATHVRPV